MECSYKYGSKFVKIFFITSKLGGDRKHGSDVYEALFQNCEIHGTWVRVFRL